MKTALLVFSAIVASVAMLWGAFCIASILWPGPSGEWAGLGVFAAAVVDLPGGAFALAIALAVKGWRPRLRLYAIVASCVALAMPFVGQLLWINHIRFH